MDELADDGLVAELAREVLAEPAPHEFDIFPLVSEACYGDLVQAPSLQLPDEVLCRVHDVVHARARELLPEREAEMLALTIAGALVVDGLPQAES